MNPDVVGQPPVGGPKFVTAGSVAKLTPPAVGKPVIWQPSAPETMLFAH
jgi:hypothetical protein